MHSNIYIYIQGFEGSLRFALNLGPRRGLPSIYFTFGVCQKRASGWVGARGSSGSSLTQWILRVVASSRGA